MQEHGTRRQDPIETNTSRNRPIDAEARRGRPIHTHPLSRPAEAAPLRQDRAGARVLVLGGIARSLLNFRGALLEALVRHGHRVVACAPGHDDDVARALASIGVDYRPTPIERASLNPIADLRTVASLTRLMRDVQPDVFFGYTIKPVIYGSLAARFAGVPRRYAMITGLGYAFGQGGLGRRALARLVGVMYRAGLRGSPAVFFQNPDDVALFQALGIVDEEQAVLVNGSGVDLEHFAPAPISRRPPSFLLIARLIREKGILEYVEAARLVKRSHPQATFRLVGPLDSNPTAVSENELAAWRREGVVEYLGKLDDVRPAIAASSVYVLPSFYREGTPRSVLEAMAMGRPVITTDAPGCRETVIEGENGFLVPPRDPAALAEAMSRFLEQPELASRMGAASRQIAEARYDVHKVNAAMLQAMGLDGGSVGVRRRS